MYKTFREGTFAGIYHRRKQNLSFLIFFFSLLTCWSRVKNFDLVFIQVTQNLCEAKKKKNKKVKLDGHVFSRIDTDFEKENVVLDKMTFLEHVV